MVCSCSLIILFELLEQQEHGLEAAPQITLLLVVQRRSIQSSELTLEVELVAMNEASIIVTLLLLASGTFTIEVVLLLKGELASWDVLDPLIYVRDCQLFSFRDAPAGYNEHPTATEDCDTIGPAAVIDEIGGPVKPSARTQ